MRKIRCYECGKSYDFDVDDFCPKCGAFNQPGKQSRIGADGSVIRVEGINEKNHAESFAHREFHAENKVRRTAGLSKSEKRTVKTPPPTRPVRQQSSGWQQKQKSPFQYIVWVIMAVIFINMLSAILGSLF